MTHHEIEEFRGLFRFRPSHDRRVLHSETCSSLIVSDEISLHIECRIKYHGSHGVHRRHVDLITQYGMNINDKIQHGAKERDNGH